MGRALGRSLRKAGWRITVVVTQSDRSAKRAARFIGGGRPVAGVPATLAGAATILITVPDDAIARVASELARAAGERMQAKVILHTSGALGPSVLEPFRRCGAAVGSMHPLQTFNGVNAPPLAGKVFAIDGDERAIKVARRIARSLGGVPVGISAQNKPLYHAAGAFAAGLSLAMIEAGVEMLLSAGLGRREAEKALLSLTRQMLENYEKLGPGKAWTGPLSRGDFGVVAVHEEALCRLPPEFLGAYQAVSRLAARVLAKNPAAVIRKLNAISESVKPSGTAKGGYQ